MLYGSTVRGYAAQGLLAGVCASKTNLGEKESGERGVGHCKLPAGSARSVSQCVCKIIQSRRRVPPVLGSWGVCLGKAANGAGLLRAQLRIMGSEQKVLHLPHVAHGRSARVPKRVAVIQQMDTETVGLQAPLGMEHVRGAIELVQRVGRPHGSEPHPGAEPRKNCEAGARTRVHSTRSHALPWNARAHTCKH